MVCLMKVSEGNRALLWQLLQQYLQEMAQYYDLAMDADGNYAYRYFDAYFTDPDRKAFLICCGEKTAGFALINPHSYIEKTPDHVLAEFFILPEYRRMHIGYESAQCILHSFPGRWEIKYNEKNAAASKLWNRIASQYGTVRHGIGDDETVLEFCV